MFAPIKAMTADIMQKGTSGLNDVVSLAHSAMPSTGTAILNSRCMYDEASKRSVKSTAVTKHTAARIYKAVKSAKNTFTLPSCVRRPGCFWFVIVCTVYTSVNKTLLPYYSSISYFLSFVNTKCEVYVNIEEKNGDFFNLENKKFKKRVKIRIKMKKTIAKTKNVCYTNHSIV
jgi:hypothetical protein